MPFGGVVRMNEGLDRAAVEAEARRLARQQEGLRERLGARAAYRKLFLDEQGRLKPEAEIVIGDLARAAQMGRVLIAATDNDLREQAAKRSLILHLFARLSRRAMEQIARKLEN